MGIHRRLSGVLALCALAASVSSLACGVADESLAASATPSDASASRDASEAGPIEPGDIPSDAAVQSEAAAPVTDASDATDSQDDSPITTQDGDDAPHVVDPPTTDNEVCHVVWPWATGDSPDPQMAVDSSGNAYLAFGYEAGDSPVLDMSVTGAGYAEGFAVAKVDAACHLVWMRDFGTNSTVDGSLAVSSGIAVDANSNVTVLGVFMGSVDLGAGPTSDLPIFNDGGPGRGAYNGFLLRLDAAGNMVFSKVFPSSLPSSLAVSPSGVSTVLADGGSGTDFGNGPVPGTNPSTVNHYFVQFDGSGAVLREEALLGSYTSLTSDPGGGLWALGYVDTDAGLVQSLIRLTSIGDFVWSRLLGPDGGSFAVNGTGEVVFSSSGPYASPLYETVTNYSSDGTPTSSQIATVDYSAESIAEQVLLDGNGNTFVGGNFEGTLTVYEDGSFSQTNTPSGAGFQRFDSSGILRSVTVWSGENSVFGAIGAAPNGNVMVAGRTVQGGSGSSPVTVFLVRFVP